MSAVAAVGPRAWSCPCRTVHPLATFKATACHDSLIQIRPSAFSARFFVPTSTAIALSQIPKPISALVIQSPSTQTPTTQISTPFLHPPLSSQKWPPKLPSLPPAAARATPASVVSQGSRIYGLVDVTNNKSTAQQAKCSCGKQSALHCSCDKASKENTTAGPRCSCRARPAGECTCERASTENVKPDNSCACGSRPAGEFGPPHRQQGHTISS